jgi:SPP1 gp7 family putative phage head morphogenesis protein
VSWKVTADVERYDEALSHFLGRTVLTDDERNSIPAEARKNAFWVAAPLEADQVQHVFDSIGQAIEKGEPFDEWRKRVRDQLTNDAHAETVFRNATQRAYNAGRYAQMREPSVQRFRPFWMYDAILDSRTTDVCKACNGTILDAEDPWWGTHVPPLHHRCRSSIRNLRRSEAEKRGITTTAPTPEITGDWGAAPGGDPWRPDLEKYEPEIAKALVAKEPPPEPPLPPPTRTLEDLPEGDIPEQGRYDEKAFAARAKALKGKLTDTEAKLVRDYSRVDYSETRDAQRLSLDDFRAVHGDETAKHYDEFRERGLGLQALIEEHGGEKGGPPFLFRGIAVKDAAPFVNGTHVVADAIASTSRDVDRAMTFVEGTDTDGRPLPFGVLFKLANRHSGNTLPIEELSNLTSEEEILVGAGKRYKIIRTERTTYYERPLIIIHAEEVGPDAYILPNRVIRLQR